jgi:hypothetical protein
MSNRDQQAKANGIAPVYNSQTLDSDAASVGLDAMLASEDALIPSSGFLAAVMERVEHETRMPEPIPFPWKRALPGFVLAGAAAGWGALEFIRAGIPALKAAISTAENPPTIHLPAFHGQTAWVALSFGVSLASWMVASRFMRRHSIQS